jgi:hypothetical protein
MYSTQEASRLTQEFWTVFGKYMMPVLSSEGEKINWVNYKTGVKDVFFRMKTTNDTASINIEITCKDNIIQQLYFEQFQKLKYIFQERVGEEWTWQLFVEDENGKTISKIFNEKNGVHILNKEDWPELISFFKPRLIALDDFWSDVKYSWQHLT